MNRKTKADLKELVKSLDEASEFEKTYLLGRFVLQQSNCSSSSKTLSGVKIYESLNHALREAGLEPNVVSKNTFIQYLSKAKDISGTNIFCKGRKQGFYTREENQLDGGEDSACEAPEAGESALYPLFKEWLANKGYQVKRTADGKKNGIWGNPDIVGIKVTEVLHQKTIELVSIECKPSPNGWQRWLFEAVAHRRFADRAYFAFVQSEDALPKMTEELFRDAEYYNVGILVLKMEDSAYQLFSETGQLGTGFREIVELYPAPLSTPQLVARKKFFETQEIREESDLHMFGQEKKRP